MKKILTIKQLDVKNELNKHIADKYISEIIPYFKWKVGITRDEEERKKQIIAKFNKKIKDFNKTVRLKSKKKSEITSLRFWHCINSSSNKNALIIEKEFCSLSMSRCKVQRFHKPDSKFVYVFRIPNSILEIEKSVR